VPDLLSRKSAKKCEKFGSVAHYLKMSRPVIPKEQLEEWITAELQNSEGARNAASVASSRSAMSVTFAGREVIVDSDV
jgi:hypothetical protein